MALDDVHLHMPIHDIEHMSMLHGMVLIEVFDNRNMTKSGISIPITIDNPFIPTCGTVIKKPDNISFIEMGDNVIIEKYKGKRVLATDCNRQFLLLHHDYILCKTDKLY